MFHDGTNGKWIHCCLILALVSFLSKYLIVQLKICNDKSSVKIQDRARIFRA